MTLTLDPVVPVAALVAAGLALLALDQGPLWRGSVALGRRLAALALALAAVVLGIAPLARPALEVERRAPARALVLVDRSRSMATEDSPGGGSRYEAARGVAAALAREVPGVEVVVREHPEPLAGEEPGSWARRTALGEALASARRRDAGEAPGAVVLVSDGAQTAGRDPEAAARDARAAGILVFAVGVGSADRPPPPRVARVELRASGRVAGGTRVPVSVSAELEGLEGAPVQVELLLDGNPLATSTLEARGARCRREARFETALGAEGLHALVARVRSGDHEGSASLRLHVLPGQVRVALVDAPARWEHRWLRRALEDSPRVRLSRLDLPDPGEVGEAGSPSTRAVVAAVASADVVILGDVPRRALAPEVGEALRRAVDREGKGLLALGGRRGFAAVSALGLAGLLPVEVVDDLSPVPGSFRAGETDAGRAFLARALGVPEDEARRVLGRLPALGTHVPAGGARGGGIVLLEGPGRRPLLALGRWGLGRTAVLATDETWRWAFQPEEPPPGAGPREAHRALVREVVTWLASPAAGLALPLALVPDEEAVPPGGYVAGRVELDPALAGARVLASLEDGSATLASADATRGFRLAVPPGAGRAELVLRAVARDGAGAELARDERIVRVEPGDAEDRVGEPADPDRLARIADAGGGAVFAPEDVARGDAARVLARALERTGPVVRETRPLAAGAGWVIALVLCLCATWALRRGAGLR